MSDHHYDHHDHHDHHDHAGHDHSHDLTPVLQSLLHKEIDFDAIVTLNEADPKSGAAIVKKTWAERLNPEPELQSDTDEQLLMHIPAERRSFTGQAKLHSILLCTSNDNSAPMTLKLFRNRDNLDFSAASEVPPTQKLIIPQSSEIVDLPVNRAHWNMTRSITLFFEDNYGQGDEDVTRISYLAFKGEFMALNREPVTFLYEAAANPSDHVKIAGVGGINSKIGTGK
ncbi:MAG: hypothetical protein M1834_001903 [Cirrosporium novae-zelandiae]|nr:MAG: hypothetical protein M1834_001903 [Cirrosporium novae-zelandiae]